MISQNLLPNKDRNMTLCRCMNYAADVSFDQYNGRGRHLALIAVMIIKILSIRN